MKLWGCNYANYTAVRGGGGSWRGWHMSWFTAGSKVTKKRMEMVMKHVSGFTASYCSLQLYLQTENIWRFKCSWCFLKSNLHHLHHIQCAVSNNECMPHIQRLMCYSSVPYCCPKPTNNSLVSPAQHQSVRNRWAINHIQELRCTGGDQLNGFQWTLCCNNQ